MNRRHGSASVSGVLVLGLLASLLLVGVRATAALASLPTGGMSAAALNSAFTTYGDTGGQWSGGDSTVSIPLPDGRDVWLFSDTLLGTVNADHSRPQNSPFIHNSMVIQDGTSLVSTRYGGTATAPDSLVKPATGTDQYWVGDGTVEGSVLRVLYLRMRTTGTGPLDFVQVDTALVTFALPGLTVQSITDLGLGAGVAWGSTVVEDGAYTYIYGSEYADGMHFAHLARVPAGGLGGVWEFWTGAAWSTSATGSARILSGVGTGFGLQKVGSQYVLVTQENNLLFSPTFVAYTATSPTGPFSGPVQLFTAPEPGSGSAVIVYDSRMHPELAASGKLLVSYNVNSLTPADTYANVALYRPRFVEVDWPRPVPNPAGLPAAPTALTATSDPTGSVHLAWQAPAGTGLTYAVSQRDVTAGQTHFAQVSHVDQTSADVNWFNKTGHTYQFVVTAQNATGEGPPSAVASATVTIAAPPAPTGVTATASGDGTATLTWSAVPYAWRYDVLRRDVTAGETEFARDSDPTPNDLTFTTGSLEPGHQYAFEVVAVHGGGQSPPSAAVTATIVYDAPIPPTGLTATAQTDGTIALAWTDPQAGLWFLVSMRDVTAGETAFTQLALPITTCCTMSAGYLTNNHHYEFTVKATNRGGTSAGSNTASATAHYPLPAMPTNLQATPDNGRAVLTWTGSSSTWFLVYMRDITAGETVFTQLALPVTSCCTMTAGYLTNGHTYEFKVSASSAGGEGPASAPVQVIPVAPPPGTVTGLTATAQSDGTITLGWTTPSTDLWYLVSMRDVTAGETTFTQLAFPITSCCAMNAGYLSNNHVYEFKVAATNSSGIGPASNVASATSHYALPAAPTNLRGQTAGPATIELTWDPPATNLYYWVYYRDVTAAATTFTKSVYPTDKTTATWGSLADGHTYEFKVTADNPGGEGPASAAIQIVAVGGVPQPASSLAAVAGDGQATLTWTASPTSGTWYAVYMRDVTVGQSWQRLALPVTTCCTFTGGYLVNGHSYEFKLTAINGFGESAPSNVVSVQPMPALPAAPSGLTATAGDTQATLHWTASPSPNVMYIVFMRDATTGQAWQQLPLPITTCCSFTGGYLTNGDTYQFKVVAANLAGQSAASNVVSVRPMPPLPQAPTGLTASPGDGTVTLAWTASPTPNVWYLIEFKTQAATAWTRLSLPVTTCCSFTGGYLTNAVMYDWRVLATNLAGVSAPSGVASAMPMPPFPQAPVGLTTTNLAVDRVTLTWTPNGTTNAWYWIDYRLAGDLAWKRAYYPASGTTVTMSGGFFDGEVYEFRVSAFNVAGISAPSYPADVVIPRAVSAWTRQNNEYNHGNAQARSWIGGSCGFASGQTVCFDSHPPFNSSKPSTWGDYMLYPYSESDYDTRLTCEAYKRANLRYAYGRSAATTYGPDLPRHEEVHSLQWARTPIPGLYMAAYSAASLDSLIKTGNPWQENYYEKEAGLLLGGYENYPSPRPYTWGGSWCEWLYR